MRLTTKLKVLCAVLALIALYATAPQQVFTDCEGVDIPRHCVD